MSHYHTYDEANSIDKGTIALVNGLDGKGLYDSGVLGRSELCGLMPVTAILIAAKDLGYGSIKLLKYANSGDTYGDKSRVVGYMSAVIYKGPGGGKEMSMLNDIQKKRLLQIARESITGYLKDGNRRSFKEDDIVLNKEMGAFVTLHENGELRGCIGNMIGHGPLFKTVAGMAIESATGDPRFHALAQPELDKVQIEISVLSPLKRVQSYEDVKIPGDGVLVRNGFSSGVYLPQVATETGWNREQFLTSLCGQKAGIKPDAWKDPETEIYVFSAEVFGEEKR
jgi:AmmeMemoRadiSam system protein A